MDMEPEGIVRMVASMGYTKNQTVQDCVFYKPGVILDGGDT